MGRSCLTLRLTSKTLTVSLNLECLFFESISSTRNIPRELRATHLPVEESKMTEDELFHPPDLQEA